jgi:putative membrane protein insertion efficiency factor
MSTRSDFHKTVRRIIIFFIRIYKRFISPILPNSCRFYPTCSQYAIDAVAKYGAAKGTAKAAYRILRCNPFNKGGYDPVK